MLLSLLRHRIQKMVENYEDVDAETQRNRNMKN